MSPIRELVDRPRSGSVPAPRAADAWERAGSVEDTVGSAVRSRLRNDRAAGRPAVPPPARPVEQVAARPEPVAVRPEPVAVRPEPVAVPAERAPARASRRRPPRHRAPLLLAAAVLGAVLTTVLTGLSGPDAPVASGVDYGLGVDAEASFAGGIDASARSEVSQAEAQERLNAIAASRAARAPQFVVPTQNYRLTTCYCMRWGSMHWGLDLAAPLGTPIYAASDGVVLRAGPATGFGNAVYIQDADGNVEIYGHMRYYSVKAGDVVSAGDQIAKVGNQGQSTGPHLHFEIHLGGMNGKPTDPSKWLAARGLTV
ncbi:M23 family metallopeptidase [Modestobacter sp. NPDC049651]|uniref:M23 family metallopeptidase n=1 Tax=unclassified Modestobacter TaxID=2643866 RepID=UPI0033D30DE7